MNIYPIRDMFKERILVRLKKAESDLKNFQNKKDQRIDGYKLKVKKTENKIKVLQQQLKYHKL
jgi:hypothetical protein